MVYTDEWGYVNQIQSFSVNDGNGLRTNIFLSGCPLRCRWCSNPETWTVKPKLAVFKEKCAGCNECVNVCISKCAVNLSDAKDFSLESCISCGMCVDECPTSARKIMSKKMTVKEVVDKVRRDIIFFRESDGGVTFSGGEPTVQREFLSALVDAHYDLGINMAIETCGYFIWDEVKDIVEKLDFIFVDIKHMDGEKHAYVTGKDNKLILENIKKMGKLGKEIVVRIPLIRGINDDAINIISTAEFVRDSIPNGKIEILPYHNLGTYKYNALGLSEFCHKFNTPNLSEIQNVKDMILGIGVEIADFK